MKDLIAELDAKAWQSSRRTSSRGAHVCHKAAREIERLRRFENASDAEKGWRTFWAAFSDYLDLGRSQRRYGWHDLMDACEKGIAAVETATSSPNARPTGVSGQDSETGKGQ